MTKKTFDLDIPQLAEDDFDLRRLKEKWPSAWVAREKVPDFTGGAVSSGRLANLDSIGKGPPGRMKVGRKVVYPVDEFLTWLEKEVKRLA